jgi:hypothetical protein
MASTKNEREASMANGMTSMTGEEMKIEVVEEMAASAWLARCMRVRASRAHSGGVLKAGHSGVRASARRPRAACRFGVAQRRRIARWRNAALARAPHQRAVFVVAARRRGGSGIARLA